MKTPTEKFKKFPSGVTIPAPRHYDSDPKPIKGVSRVDIDKIQNFQQLAAMIIGYDCIISTDKIVFQQLLVRCIPAQILWTMALKAKERKAALYQDYHIQLEDMGFEAISIRMPGKAYHQGKYWFRNMNYYFDEDISGELLERRYKETLSAFNLFPRLLPPQKLALELIMMCSASKLPNVRCDMPEEVLELAYNCSQTGRMEAVEVGRRRHVIDVDGNKFYGAILSEEPCMKHMRWLPSTVFDKDADKGYYHAIITVPHGMEGPVPFVYQYVGDHNVFPTGVFEKVAIAKPDVELLLRYGCTVNILSGWQGYATDSCKPFEKPMQILQDKLGDPIIGDIAAQMISISWGKTSGIYDKFTSSMYNPTVASDVTSKARSRIYDLGQILNRSIIAYTIDGIVVRGDEAFPYHLLSEQFGKFKKKYEGSMVSYADPFRRPSDNSASISFEENAIYTSFGKHSLNPLVNCNSLEHAVSIVSKLGQSVSPEPYPYGFNLRKQERHLTLSDIENDRIRVASPKVAELEEIYTDKLIQKLRSSVK